jgi:anti-sigma B factor antagonist
MHETSHAVLVAGELDLDVAPKLRACLTDLIEDGARTIVVDLLEVTFMDSTGLGALVQAGKRLRQADGELILVADSPSITKLLTITGVGRLFRIETSLLTAVDHVVDQRL